MLIVSLRRFIGKIPGKTDHGDYVFPDPALRNDVCIFEPGTDDELPTLRLGTKWAFRKNKEDVPRILILESSERRVALKVEIKNGINLVDLELS